MDWNGKVKEQLRLDFPVLSDPGNGYARSLGLVHGFPEDLREVYHSFGLGLPDYNGDDAWELPLATRMVVDGAGVIRSVTADADYTRRPEPVETLEILRALA